METTFLATNDTKSQTPFMEPKNLSSKNRYYILGAQ